MFMQRTIISHNYPHNIPIIDGEFDRFELNSELSGSLHDAEMATFYHNALDIAE